MLVERISAVHQVNYGVYGVRKMWHALRRDRIDIGREHTARLMRLAGVFWQRQRPITGDHS
ncbi:IS3 family transposase [Corynebacterium pseudodiphtheriticum]|uniref:IS3 family transposase n=1 Tax=Corynebacterium pseudodiphtheriticum TaxID=37637 RepID=UPI003D764F95